MSRAASNCSGLDYFAVVCTLLYVVGRAQFGAVAAAASPAVRWQGSVDTIRAGCPDASGSSSVSLTARSLPKGFNEANVSCSAIPWFPAFKGLALSPQATSTEALQAQTTLLAAVRNTSLSPAIVTTVTSFNQSVSQNSIDKSGESVKYLVQCKLAALQDNSTIALIANGSSGIWTVLTPVVPITRSVINSISPNLGPAVGGTNITILGKGLNSLAACTFSNSSATVSVPATIVNSTTLTCTTPPWHVSPGTDLLSLAVAQNEAVSLVVTSGDCSAVETFQYYDEPQVTSVSPLQGPRYGSFAFTVRLGCSLSSLDPDGMDALHPSIRIKGGDSNGSDLTLAANLTADRTALMAATPLERTPLATGNHEIHVSLNGQQFADVQTLDTSVLMVQGPTLGFDQPLYSVTDSSQISIGVDLEGQSNLPVTVNVSAVMRSVSACTALDNSSGADSNLGFSFNQSVLAWGPGETGVKRVIMNLSGNLSALDCGGIIISLEDADNADISIYNSSSIVSSMSQEELMVGFTVHANQVVYRGDNASLPIQIQNAAMRLPATIEYRIVDVLGTVPSYLSPAQQSGVLEWDAEVGSWMDLDLDIDWDNVTFQTEDHLLIELGAGWNARSLGEPDSVALHVFGVDPGQCPPGTFRFRDSIAPAPGPSLSLFQSTAGWLRSIQVQDSRNWFFDLSSQFQPDVPEYGVILPAEAAVANLCLEPKEEYEVITVTDSIGQVMQEEADIVPSPSLTYTAPPSVGRRILAGSPAPAPSLQTGAGLRNALGRPGRGDFCQGPLWSLPLQAGQNVFSITHGELRAAGALPPAKALAPTNGTTWSAASPVSMQASQDMTYSLSVVRLADPSHAEMLELNLTAGNTTITVCSGVSGRASQRPTSSYWDLPVPVCSPSSSLSANVSSQSAMVSLQPSLRHPEVQNVRIEVAGQVLSQGGNVGADQLADTSDKITERLNAEFLPVAYIVGLQPGSPVVVPILVVAEDGVTSSRYSLTITRQLPTDNDEARSPGFLTTDEGAIDTVDGPTAGEDADSFLDVTLSLANSLATPPPPPAIPITAQAHASWPTPPSRQPVCHLCPAGWATTRVDETHCSMCVPGTFAASPQSPVCTECMNGSYTNSWGSTTCNHCIMGTFAPSKGSRLCFMCPENMTNLEDGSYQCNVPVGPGTNLLMRYAVIVSFGVYLNGTTLETIASKVGVNASSTTILERLIGLDTASAFNITARDVNVTAIQQVGRRVLLVNVTATLGVDLPSNSSNNDVQTELAVKNLSADEAIHMLALYPDKFLARTTKALDVTAAQGEEPASKVESRPRGARGSSLLPWYGIVLVLLAGLAIAGASFGLWRRHSKLINGCWPRRHRPYAGFVEGSEEQEVAAEHGTHACRGGLGNLVSRGRNTSASADHLPMLNTSLSSSSHS